MNILKYLGIFAALIIQTLVSVYLIADFETIFDDDFFLGIFLIIILGGLGYFTLWIRGLHEGGLFLIIPEIIIAPLGIIRVIVCIVALVKSGASKNLVFGYDEFDKEPDNVLQQVVRFLFFFFYDGEREVTRWSNLFTILFICIPISGALFGCWYLAYSFFVNGGDNILNLWLGLSGITILSCLFCFVRGQESVVTFYSGDLEYKAGDIKINLKVRNENIGRRLNDEARNQGMDVVSNGYGNYFTGWAIATMIFAPVFIFTQIISLIFAIISFFTDRICSSYTKLDYDDFNYPFWQRILQFFFNFVID